MRQTSEQFVLPAGSELLIGEPAVPMPDVTFQEIACVVRSIDGIVEAHVPLVYCKGTIDEPRQMLAIVIDSQYDATEIASLLALKLRKIIPTGSFIDVWRIPNADLLDVVRCANCTMLKAREIPNA